MTRLRRADCAGPGIRRVRRGKGFSYLDDQDRPIRDAEVVERIRELVIPPAWREVWICPYPMGHIQATGTDAAGRKQYRYHDRWRDRRDREKFDSMTEFARALPRLREQVAVALAADDQPTRERVLACAVRLLDRGSFRIGSEGYAAENDTYGLATIRKEHVTLGNDATIVFDYTAKGGVQKIARIVDADAHLMLGQLQRRRGGGPELLAFKEGARWRDVRSPDINEFLKEVSAGKFTAKDFRTWNATVLAAVALAVSRPAGAGSKTARKRAMRRAVDEVARYLGNTPAVCRASYIDPRVFDRFDGGLTISGVLPELLEADDWPAVQPSIELAVLDLIAGDESSPAIEDVAEAA